MMIYMPNHGTRTLVLTRLLTVLQSIHKILRTPNLSQFKYSKVTVHPRQDFQKIPGSHVEQTTEPVENYPNEIPQQISENDQHKQKAQKDTDNSPDDDILKTLKTPKTPHCKKNP